VAAAVATITGPTDPGEHTDLAMLPSHRVIAEDILRRMQEAEAHWFDPDRGEPDDRACQRWATSVCL
jgi:hypothetical protein